MSEANVEAIPSGDEATATAFDSTDSAVEAVMNRWEDAQETELSDGEENSNVEVEATTTEDEPVIEDDTTDEVDEDRGDEVDDDTEVQTFEVKVDGELHSVSLDDLQKAWGIEKSLSRKTEAVAHERKELEDKTQYFEAGLQQMYQVAEKRFQPYAQIDWAVAQKEMETEDFKALREEAHSAYEEVQFFGSSVGEYVQQAEAQRNELMRGAAEQALVQLKQEIPNFGKETYREISEYAVEQGMPQEVVGNLVDASALKMIWKDIQFDKGIKVANKKKAQTPKKVSKAGISKGARTADDATAALNKLRSTHSKDDAMNALIAGWNS